MKKGRLEDEEGRTRARARAEEKGAGGEDVDSLNN